ncbi:RNA-binding motif protein, X chromosome-like [Bubalus kerabau]|uniref:RNA-binding motif protein, X chromosome-like n=1 Tax=Bubalus carabanensis TaxID=3119969 RepID=UPI00244E7CD4|nr:RNA-binding motif protein, X chromosome-like [Bubalus carabanensis]
MALPAGEGGAGHCGPRAPPKPLGRLRARGLRETPARPGQPARAPGEPVKDAGTCGASAQLPPENGHPPPADRRPLSPPWLLLSRSFSPLPPAFRHRPGISAGKKGSMKTACSPTASPTENMVQL